MRPKINFITLLVSDLKRSVDFYKNGLELPCSGEVNPADNHFMFDLEDKFHMVLFQDTPSTELEHQKKMSKFILSHNADNREEVDKILSKTLQFGAKQIGDIQNETWGYSANICDPDGHQWEIIYMPHYQN